MSIQIIENFELGNSKPIDNRMVVGASFHYTTKESITHKYEGMKVWDADLFTGYIWTDGAWIPEIINTGTVGPGTIGNIPKFTAATVIGDSIITELGGNIGIGLGATASEKLEVGGNVKATNFIGNLSADYLTSGSLPLTRLRGTSNYILVGNGTSVASSWQNLDTLTVRTSSYVNINNTLSSTLRMIPIISISSTIPTYESPLYRSNIYFQNSKLGIGTSTISETLTVNGSSYISGVIKLGDGTRLLPSYTFNSQVTTGFYKTTSGLIPFTTNEIGITIEGINRFAFRKGNAVDSSNNTSLAFYNSTGASPNYIEYTTDNFLLSCNTQVNGVLSVVNIGSFAIQAQGSIYTTEDLIADGAKTFRIKHPLDIKDTYLYHAAVESARVENIYRGKIQLNNGNAQVNLDIEFNMTQGTLVSLNNSLQCFTTNETGWTMVKGSINGNILTIESNVKCNDWISWLVIGERKDESIRNSKITNENGRLIAEQKS